MFETKQFPLVFGTSRGAQKAHRAVPNEALYGVLRISRLITWTYLRISVYLHHGKGLSQEPYDDLFGSTRLSQSGIHLFIYFILVVAQG